MPHEADESVERARLGGILGAFQVLPQLHEIGAGHQRASAGEHLGFFLLGVVLHELLQHLGLGRELIGAWIRVLDLGQDEVEDAVFLAPSW